jgi:hypothetical protein
MKRFLDIVGLVALAFVVLIPRPSVEVKPAVEKLDANTERRIAELQAALLGDPKDLEAAIEVAEIYREVHRPEWALATLGPLRANATNDYRVWFGISMAHAERFEFEDAYRTLGQALAACGKGQGAAACGAAAETRMRLVYTGLKRIMDQKIDPHRHPELVQEIMYQTLRNVRNRPPPKTAAPPSPAKTPSGK